VGAALSGLPGLSYDADGNLLNDSFHTYTWDADGHMISADSATFTYDAFGRMAEERNGSAINQFQYLAGGQKVFSATTGSTLNVAYVQLPGGTNAVYLTSGLGLYVHADWLGSGRLRTTTGQHFSGDNAYAPFGEPYALSGGSWIQFAENGNQWSAAGVDDFMYRRYHPTQGRWLSPDPAGMAAADSANPQSWNRYAYVGNSPLNAVDPLGLKGCDDSPDLPCEGEPGEDEGGRSGSGDGSDEGDNGEASTGDDQAGYTAGGPGSRPGCGR
jgi:RHS repeat-associated protein